MFDIKTLTQLEGWSGYLAVDLECRSDEGWMGRGKLLNRLEQSRKMMRCSRCGARSQADMEFYHSIRSVKSSPGKDAEAQVCV